MAEDIEALKASVADERREHGEEGHVCIALGYMDAIIVTLEHGQEYLCEKNEIIKAYAGPKGMTPEDVAYALERAERVEKALTEIRGLFVVDQWWRGNRARYVVRLIDAALEGRDGWPNEHPDHCLCDDCVDGATGKRKREGRDG